MVTSGIIKIRMRFPNCLYVDLEGISGGLVLWWNDEVDCHISM